MKTVEQLSLQCASRAFLSIMNIRFQIFTLGHKLIMSCTNIKENTFTNDLPDFSRLLQVDFLCVIR